MYKPETIVKTVKALKAAVSTYKANIENGEQVNICISSGNKKIGRVLNVSLAPIMTCPNCSGCKAFCYDVKAVNQYSNTVLPARARNTALAFFARDEFFRLIDEKMSRRRKNKFSGGT